MATKQGDAAATASLDISDFEAKFDLLFKKIDSLDSHLAKANTHLEKTEKGVNKVGKAFGVAKNFLAAFGVALGFGALVSYTRSLIGLSARLYDTATATGTTVPKLQELERQLSGRLNADQTEQALTTLHSAMVAAAQDGGGLLARALKNIGIESKDFSRDTSEVFSELVTRVKSGKIAVEDLRVVFGVGHAEIISKVREQVSEYKTADKSLRDWTLQWERWAVAALNAFTRVENGELQWSKRLREKSSGMRAFLGLPDDFTGPHPGGKKTGAAGLDAPAALQGSTDQIAKLAGIMGNTTTAAAMESAASSIADFGRDVSLAVGELPKIPEATKDATKSTDDLVSATDMYMSRLNTIAENVAPSWLKQIQRLRVEQSFINQQIEYYKDQTGAVAEQRRRELESQRAINVEQQNAFSIQQRLIGPSGRQQQRNELRAQIRAAREAARRVDDPNQQQDSLYHAYGRTRTGDALRKRAESVKVFAVDKFIVGSLQHATGSTKGGAAK